MDLKTFLINHKKSKFTDKNVSVTHTSIGGGRSWGGSYHIPNAELPEFYKVYKKYIDEGGKASLTEKFPYKLDENGNKEYEASAICIDFDFRFLPEIKERQHTPEMIEKVVHVLYAEINKIFDIQGTEETLLVVQEKPNIYVDAAKNITKDGVHFIFPYLLCKPEVQCIIRKNTMTQIAEILSELPSQNDIKDIYDESVCKFGSGWMMPYSSKPNCEAYKNISLYNWDTTEGVVEIEQDITMEDLSINKIYRMSEYTYREEYQDIIEKEALKLNKKPMKKTVSMPTIADKKNELILVEELMKILDPQRAEDYDTWIYTGMCLYNINSVCNLPIWIEFSRQSDGKYEEGVCDKMWYGFKDSVGGPSLASLKRWAEEDNFYKATEVINSCKIIEDVVLHSFSKDITHHSIAKVIKKRAMENFVSCEKRWFSFNGVRWKETKDAMNLRKFISKEICELYMDWQNKWNKLSTESEDDLQAEIYKDRAKKCAKIFIKLGDAGYKDKVIKECKELFIDDEFMDKIDANRDLIGFENGVYDLKEKMFRQGHPHDYICMSTKINYNDDIHETDDVVDKVDKFIEQVFPIAAVREFAMLLMASCLSGHVLDHSFHVWTGDGGNGKSKIIELLKMVLGDYACELPVGYLTQKRGASGSASPEVMRCKNRRFCFMQEPNKEDAINIGKMKEITGGDTISGRQLFQDQDDFDPMFKVVLMCNDLPKIPGMDNGTWRRIKVTEFISTFKDNPDEKETYSNEVDKKKYKCEFPIDRHLSKNFELWKGVFMWKLINKFQKFDIRGNEPPDEVTQYTDKYMEREDIIAKFVKDNIVTDSSTSGTSIAMIYNKFKVWCQEIGTLQRDVMKRPALQEYFEKDKTLKGLRVPGRTVKFRIKFIDELADHESDENAHANTASNGFFPSV